MKKQMSKSIDEYLANDGWSSSLFLNHAKFLFVSLKELAFFKVGRTVIHVFTKTKTLKFYVHHNGRSKEHLTITDANGNELKTYHCSEKPEVILADVKQMLDLK